MDSKSEPFLVYSLILGETIPFNSFQRKDARMVIFFEWVSIIYCHNNAAESVMHSKYWPHVWGGWLAGWLCWPWLGVRWLLADLGWSWLGGLGWPSSASDVSSSSGDQWSSQGVIFTWGWQTANKYISAFLVL